MASYYDEKNNKEHDLRSVIPEASDPLVEMWAPQLKKNPSYWQVGTSGVTRVKIDALCPRVEIRTERATQIIGTSSEYLNEIKTLGTTVIYMLDIISVEVHVTRSHHMSPFMADGILGHDFLKKSRWHFDKRLGRLYRQWSPETFILALPGASLIADYTAKLRNCFDAVSKAREEGRWSVVSTRINALRPHLSQDIIKDDRHPVLDVLEDYADCLYLPGVDKLGATSLLKYSIKSRLNEPIYIGQRTCSDKFWDEIDTIISGLLRQGILRGNSTSPYNFPIYLQEKKPDSCGHVKQRIRVDYNELNKRSETETFPIPSIHDAVDQLYGSCYFSVLDLESASYQIELEPEDCEKTAFTTRNGRYEFQRMPVGIRNASQYTQRLMNKIFEGLRDNVFVCHDDILIHTATIEEHEVIIRRVLARLRDAGLKLNTGKCQLFCQSVSYLGYVVTREIWHPNSENIKKLACQRLPETPAELRSYLGLLSTYMRFIPNYASRAKPLWDMLKVANFQWTSETKEIRNYFSEIFERGVYLRYPKWNESFIVKTGSSKHGIWAVVDQKGLPDSHYRSHKIAWASRTYTPAETKLDFSSQERRAKDFGMTTFHRYLQHKDLLD